MHSGVDAAHDLGLKYFYSITLSALTRGEISVTRDSHGYEDLGMHGDILIGCLHRQPGLTAGADFLHAQAPVAAHFVVV